MERPGEVNVRVIFVEENNPSLDALELLVDGLKPLLKEYARAFVGEELDWGISSLKFSSIGLGIFPDQSKHPHLEDPLRNMSRRFVQDLASLEGGMNPELTLLGPDTRPWMKWVQLITTQNVSRIEVASEGISTSLTSSGAGAIELPRPAGALVDTVRGVIQGVNFFNGRYFTLHREGDETAIRCYFPESMEDAVVSNLRKRVAVTGKVKRDALGIYQSIVVTLPPRRLLGRDEVPRIAELVGIAPDLVAADLLGSTKEEPSRAR